MATVAPLSVASPVPSKAATKGSCLVSHGPVLSFSPCLASTFPLTLRSSPRPAVAAAEAPVGSSVQGVLAEGDAAAEPALQSIPSLAFRVGHGCLPLIIGGVVIPHDRGCEARSDGDVLLHCVVDAILGALGLPDIGRIFPDSDPKWRGAAFSVFVREADAPMCMKQYCRTGLNL